MLLDDMNREHHFFADNFVYTRNVTASLIAVYQERQADVAKYGSLTLSVSFPELATGDS